MTLLHRVLPESPVSSLADYERAGGCAGLPAARASDPQSVLAIIEESGLRGRGGAGFPTGRKWRTVLENASGALATTVVVNGAEGEPGSFKDRAILRANPYAVVEGALIAAHVVGARRVVIALKETFVPEIERVERAAEEMRAAGLIDDATVAVEVARGPEEYLFGEETGLLEVLEGRPPFPRIAPPFRRGAQDVVRQPDEVASDSGLPAPVGMAGPADELLSPPALVNNVETMANVPAIVAQGAAWFREVGTAESPGTIVCTVSGATQRHAVGEVAMGTPVREIVDAVGGGAGDGRRVKAVLSGVANAVLTGAELDTPATHEALEAIGSGLGAASFLVFDDEADMVSVAAGVSRFLAVESCGQCTPCKQDGLAIAAILDRICGSAPDADDRDELTGRLATVADEARCSLAAQHQVVIGSIAGKFEAELDGHLAGRIDPVAPMIIAEIVDLDDEDGAIVNIDHARKQPDWTFDDEDSGQSPADRLGEHRQEPS